MDPIELLHSRKSHNKLIGPAPSQVQLEIMFKAALRAPDHALLRPWRYRVYSGESLYKLGESFASAMRLSTPDISDEKIAKLKLKPTRAPMVIVASVMQLEHPKVPLIEQVLSAGASIQNLLMAAHFQGIGAIWRTGSMAFDKNLLKLLDFTENEIIVGFIYLGTEEGDKRAAKEFDIDEFVTQFN